MDHLRGAHEVLWIAKNNKHREVHPTMDSASGGVDGVVMS